MARFRSPIALSLVALLLAGCPGTAPTTPIKPTPKAGAKQPDAAATPAPKPVAVPADALAKAVAGLATRAVAGGVATTLSGQVRVIANNGGGIISDNGAGVISNNSGGIISDNGAGVVGGNTAGLVANNGGGYRLADAAPAELRLADAVVTVRDARGNLLTGPDGKPLAGYTDRQGRYVLSGALPTENVVLTIKLWNGGELTAMRPKDGGADQPLDTATSLGASYVLTTFVKGDQGTFDKLPAAEADALRRAIEAGRDKLQGVPSYTAADLLARADGLRQAVPAVGKKLEDIRALLIGQANLGDGRLATEVALPLPRAMLVDARGHLLLVDAGLGRIRDVAPDGTLSTLGDVYRGTLVKQNFLNAEGLAQGGDGTYYVTAGRRGTAIAPDGTTRFFAGNGGEDRTPAGPPATAMAIVPRTPVVAPDGRIWVLDDTTPGGGAPHVVRLLELAKDGTTSELPLPAELAGLQQNALGRDAAGNLYVTSPTTTEQRILKRTPAGGWSLVASWPETLVLGGSGFAVAADGTAYSTDELGRQVRRVAPDGTVTVVAGRGAPGEAGAIQGPGALAAAPDGTLYVSDEDRNVVVALAPSGAVRPVAGASGVVSRAGDLTAIALNAPFDVAVDARGGFFFSENMGFALKRFTGAAVEPVAGNARGRAADDGPALASPLDNPAGVAQQDGTTWVLDTRNGCLRRIDPAGVMHWAAGPRAGDPDPRGKLAVVEPGTTCAPDAVHLREARFIAVGPDGRPYWTSGACGQVLRLDADGRVAQVAGMGIAEAGRVAALAGAVTAIPDGADAHTAPLVNPTGLAFDAAGDLYVSDSLACRIVRIAGATGAHPTVHPWAGIPLGELVARASAGTALDLAGEIARGRLAMGLPFPAGLAFDGDGGLLVAGVGTRAMQGLPDVAENGLLTNVPTAEAGILRLHATQPTRLIAGPGTRFFPDPTAEDALLLPSGLAIDAEGRLAICDPGANTLRILPPGTAVPPR